MGGHEPRGESGGERQEGGGQEEGGGGEGRQKRWQELTARGVAGPAHHGGPPSKAGHFAGGDEWRPALGSGLEADSGWAVEHGRAACTRGRGGGTELVRGGVLVGSENTGGGTATLME